MTDIDPAALVLGHLAEFQGLSEDAWLEGSPEDLGIRLLRLQALGRIVKYATDAIETALAERMELDTLEMPGFGRVRRSETTSSTWRYDGASEQMRDDLARAVAASVAMDVATGEIDSAKQMIALAAMREAYRAIPSFSSIKKDGGRALRLRIADYRSYSTHYRIEVDDIEDPLTKEGG